MDNRLAEIEYKSSNAKEGNMKKMISAAKKTRHPVRIRHLRMTAVKPRTRVSSTCLHRCGSLRVETRMLSSRLDSMMAEATTLADAEEKRVC